MTLLRLALVLTVPLFSCREVRPPAGGAREEGMGPEPAGTERLRPDDREDFPIVVRAELAALQSAAQRGVRLTARELDSVGALSIGGEPNASSLLEERMGVFLRDRSAKGGPPDAELASLDSLRAELAVWRIQAGPWTSR